MGAVRHAGLAWGLRPASASAALVFTPAAAGAPRSASTCWVALARASASACLGFLAPSAGTAAPAQEPLQGQMRCGWGLHGSSEQPVALAACEAGDHSSGHGHLSAPKHPRGCPTQAPEQLLGRGGRAPAAGPGILTGRGSGLHSHHPEAGGQASLDPASSGQLGCAATMGIFLAWGPGSRLSGNRLRSKAKRRASRETVFTAEILTTETTLKQPPV